MKILIVGQHIHDSIAGAEIQTEIIANHFNKRHHKVLFAIMEPMKLNYDLPYLYRPMSKPFFWSFLSVIYSFRPDIVYWRRGRNKLLAASFISRIFGSKFCFAIAHIKDTQIWNIEQIQFQINDFKSSKLSARSICKLLIGVKRFVGYAVNYLGTYLINTVFYMNNDFINTLPVKNFIKQYNSFRITSADFTWDKPYILWVSNLTQRKNPELCIALAEKLKNEKINILMAGFLSDKRYSYFSNPENLPENLFYLGAKSIDEVNGMIESSMFVIHTCNPEGFPNIFIQAWLLSKPTITLYYDPESTIVKHKLGFKSNTLEDMSRDIKKLISNSKLCTEMGTRAKSLSQKLFNSSINMQKLETHFRDIVHGQNQ